MIESVDTALWQIARCYQSVENKENRCKIYIFFLLLVVNMVILKDEKHNIRVLNIGTCKPAFSEEKR